MLVKFIPDYKRFKLQGLSDDLVALFQKRVFDLAGVMNKKAQIILNKELLKMDTFEDYAKLYFDNEESQFLIPFQADRWEILVSSSSG